MLPDWLKRILQALGVNTVRLEWKLRYWREDWKRRRSPFAPWRQTLSYEHKSCPSCGVIVDKSADVCPNCGARVGSRFAYRLRRGLGLLIPGIGGVWPAFIVLLVVVFMAEVALGGLRGFLGVSSQALIRLGALYNNPPLELIAAGQYWRFLSAGLLHGGVIHLLFNTVALSQLSPSNEQEIGPWKFIVLLTVTQIGCALTSFFWHDYTRGRVFSVGASGIAFGLIGFGLAYIHRRGGASMLRSLYIQWAIYGLLFGFMIPGVDNAAHVGGLLSGMAFAYVVPLGIWKGRQHESLWFAIAGICMLLWAYAIFSMIRFAIATAQ